jgi:Pectate lyase superfamily protein
MRVSRRTLLATATAFGLSGRLRGAPLIDQETGFPLDSGVINVKAYGAVGDGITDDTAAILAAIAAMPIYDKSHIMRTTIVYFPAGTYLVSDTIVRKTADANPYYSNLPLFGDGRSHTKIKLVNNAAGFRDAGKPKPVIQTCAHNYLGLLVANGGGNEGFLNFVENMTIDLGTGNPGAVGIDNVSNNTGSIRNVDIVTHGAASAGIAMPRVLIGPCLYSGVSIKGPFAVGMDFTRMFCNVVLENITIDGATSYGIRNRQTVINFNNLQITMAGGVGIANIDPDVLPNVWDNANEGLIVGLNGTITGAGAAALVNTASINFKNVRAAGFVVDGVPVTESYDGIYHGRTKIGDPEWSLPVKYPPAAPAIPASRWTKVTAPVFPADATAALRAAFANPNAKVVYVPNGIYKFSQAIDVADNIESIEGMFSIFINATSMPHTPTFRTSATRTKTLHVRHCIGEAGYVGAGSSGGLVRHRSRDAKVVIRSCTALGTPIVWREPGGGELYCEDVQGTHAYIFGTAGAWFRQLNLEIATTKMTIDAAPVWILGYKTEALSTGLVVTGGANVEIVGGVNFPVTGSLGQVPNIINTDSRLIASYAETTINPPPLTHFETQLRSTIRGVTWIVPGGNPSVYPPRGLRGGSMVASMSTDKLAAINAPPIINSLSGSLPVISGPGAFKLDTKEFFSPLVASTGIWTVAGMLEGAPPPDSYSYQWYLDGKAIAGGTNSTYAPVKGDVGRELTVAVKATNRYGTSSKATSSAFKVAFNGITLWFDASDSATVTVSDGKVSRWNDKSGNNNHATQQISAQRPTLQGAAQNGLNTMRFTASARQFMHLATVIDADEAGYTIVAVLRRAGPGGTGRLLLLGGTTSTGYVTWLTGSQGAQFQASSFGHFLYGPHGGLSSTGYNLVSIDMRGADGHLYLNGSNQDMKAGVGGVVVGPSQFSTVGHATFSVPTYCNGEIAEFLLFKGILSSAARQGVESYLKAKWGTP